MDESFNNLIKEDFFVETGVNLEYIPDNVLNSTIYYFDELLENPEYNLRQTSSDKIYVSYIIKYFKEIKNDSEKISNFYKVLLNIQNSRLNNPLSPINKETEVEDNSFEIKEDNNNDENKINFMKTRIGKELSEYYNYIF